MKSRITSLLGAAGLAIAQSSSISTSPSASIVTLSSSLAITTTDYLPGVTLPSTFQGSIIATTIRSSPSGSSRSGNLTTTRTTSTESSKPYTNIGGSSRTFTPTTTQNAPARPSNTQPCNNYVEFCLRKYSNITEIAAHNSPFTRQNNAARNQEYPVTQQLNDGIRVLQGQAHMVNGTLYFCHTSCDLLNEGTVEDYLRQVNAWVETHPFDVVTIIFGNYDWADKDSDGNSLVTAADFDVPVRSSGLYEYVYQPPKTAMTIDDWPTLAEMILNQKRVVTFIDYNYDTEAVPYMLWQYFSVWETPFSPTDLSFPCTIGRPEGISDEQAKRMMYLANHNLNAEIAFGGASILVPNAAQINQTNAVVGEGSLGSMARHCDGMLFPFRYPISCCFCTGHLHVVHQVLIALAEKWGRPPNFLIVDFYNQGPTPGSVFVAAAQANGVTYNRKCCGTTSRSTAAINSQVPSGWFGLLVAAAAAFFV
ncbi:PLC-like phosphodiesterase [Ampelomyces quisqualis]|uniref:PLC-like phosphodiesterase n=1 Tax=Ampelomyces quisqualis TaxID=50730 RepID=A0A6A5R2T9_AMPQU|nr:PLC-like phosphodiesterase [Ampelomyces quisqualis]